MTEINPYHSDREENDDGSSSNASNFDSDAESSNWESEEEEGELPAADIAASGETGDGSKTPTTTTTTTSDKKKAGNEEAAEETTVLNTKSRKLKTLSVLTAKFVRQLKDSPGHILELTSVSKTMKVTKRRVYDVVNVLEGCELVRKHGRSQIKWSAKFPITDVPEFQETLVDTFVRPKNDREKSVDTRKLSTLQAAEKWLDRAIKMEQQNLRQLTKSVTLDVRHPALANLTKGKTAFFMETNYRKGTMKVHDPLRDRASEQNLHQVSVDFEDKPGRVVTVTNFAVETCSVGEKEESKTKRQKLVENVRKQIDLNRLTASSIFLSRQTVENSSTDLTQTSSSASRRG